MLVNNITDAQHIPLVTVKTLLHCRISRTIQSSL